MKSLVSIIIPTYNRAHLIGETLDSVLAQTFQYWECIVVDDGSTDTTDEVMAEYIAKDARFKYYRRPKDRLPGGNAARNYGFEKSRGEYIQWFDSDDIMLPAYLEKKVAAFTPTAVLTICNGYSADANLQNRKLKNMPTITHLFKQYVLWQSGIMSPSILFRRSFIEKQNLFDETLLRGQENEFFSRIFFKLHPTAFVQLNSGLYLYRQHQVTKSVIDKTSYKSSYRKSMGLVSMYNLARGIEIGDMEIANYHYKRAIHYVFNAFYEGDKCLVRFFLQKLMAILKKPYYTLAFRLQFWISLFLFFGRPIYRIEKSLKNAELQ
ncbi:glycosyltransferase family 2 protein [Vitellibacter sp. q18]|nr:glycosyltransferase family 2 protein [Aequorivita lutea]